MKTRYLKNWVRLLKIHLSSIKEPSLSSALLTVLIVSGILLPRITEAMIPGEQASRPIFPTCKELIKHSQSIIHANANFKPLTDTEIKLNLFNKKARHHTFLVTVTSPMMSARGTAFRVNDGERFGNFILTNKHICDVPGAEFIVTNEFEEFSVYPQHISRYADLCILRPLSKKYMGIGGFKLSEKLPKRNSRVFFAGHPWGMPLTSWLGYFISRCTVFPFDGLESGDDVTIGHLSVPVYPGFSGSPVVDERGEVVGIVYAYERATHLGQFILIDTIKQFLQQIKAANK